MYTETIKSGIMLKYITLFFERKEYTYICDLQYSYKECEIKITPLDVRGTFKLPLNLIEFTGEKQSCEEAVHMFRLNFMSAGG